MNKTDSEVDQAVDLEALFESEIPCGGNVFPTRTPPCGKAAVVKRVWSHHCPGDVATEPDKNFKCFDCYLRLRDAIIALIATNMVTCHYCQEKFTDIDQFVRYEPF